MNSLTSSAKGNQIRNKMIAKYPKTDLHKLVGIVDFAAIHYPLYSCILEPYMHFSRDGEDTFLGYFLSDYNPEVPMKRADILLVDEHSNLIVFELDGPIHDKYTEKTFKRNMRYELNKLLYIVINEEDLKYELGIKNSNKLTQNDINAEFMKRMETLLR